MSALDDATLAHRDPSLPVDERVARLLGLMTLDEKIAQLGSAWVFELASHGHLDSARATAVLADGLGQVTRISGASSLDATQAAVLANEIQRHLVEHTRLGVPAIVHEEICAGLTAREATVFPQAIGVAATFRPEHNGAITDSIRRQMRAIGAHQGLSPVLDICRDPRWGRLEETYGEDPFLVGQMGVAYVRGLQGDDLREGVAATAKHFVGYGASEGGLNWAPAHLPERELRDVYLRPFEAAVRDAGLMSVMNGYHELDGVPCGANRWLLTELLRGEWGFDGIVVSDYFSVRQLEVYHRVATDGADAAATALHAGLDVELPGTDCFSGPLHDALTSGRVTMADIDQAVGRVLTTKFRLGLFEQPYVDEGRVALHARTAAQLDLAREVARDSIVLLKNDGALPLAARGSIAVIGPNADRARNLLGDYSYAAHVESLLDLLASGGGTFHMPAQRDVDLTDEVDLTHVATVLDALREALPDATVTFAEGCATNDGDQAGFDAAVAAAAAADVAVLVMGDRAGLTEACTSGESRDVSSLDLPGVQEELVLGVAATGTPVVLVLVAGRPLGSPEVHAAASAVMIAWFPGEQGAAAIADVLAGAVSPGGRLPVSYPRSSGQIPVFYGHKVSGGRSHWKGPYVDLSNEPLYPFGYGLGYSTFELDVEVIDGLVVTVDDVVEVGVTVTNTGGREADEVVQVYTCDPVASVTRPVRELHAFRRLTLGPDNAARVTFQLPVAALGFTGSDMRYVVEAGDIELFVGASAAAADRAGHVVVATTAWPSRRPPAANGSSVEWL